MDTPLLLSSHLPLLLGVLLRAYFVPFAIVAVALHGFLPVAEQTVLRLLLLCLLVHDNLDVPDLHGRAMACVARTRLAVLTMLSVHDLVILGEVALSFATLNSPFLVDAVRTF